MTRPSDTPSINDLSLLDAALEYAGRGWHVFPVQPGGKAPHRAVDQGYKDATCEEAQIRRWWTNDPDANIGLALAPSGLVALDVDSYKDEGAWETFKAKISIPETFRQRTAGGGTHYVFACEQDASYPGGLAGCPGEIKHNGYIVMAPSKAKSKGNGGALGAYEVVDDREPARAPSWLAQRGNNDNRQTNDNRPSAEAAALKGMARSEREATDADRRDLLTLLRDRQNTIPNYNDWLKVVFGVHHAFAGQPEEDQGRSALRKWCLDWSGLGRQGAHTPEHLEKGLTKAWQSARTDHVDPVTCRSAIAALKQLPPRPPVVSDFVLTPHVSKALPDHPNIPWIYGQHYLRQSLSLTVAPGGTGKSLLAINDALSIAAGRSLLGMRCYGKRRVLYMNGGEDTEAIVQARVDAAMVKAEFKGTDIAERLFIMDASQLAKRLGLTSGSDIKLAREVKHEGAQVNRPLLDAITNLLVTNRIDVLILDPLKHFHLVNENDNGQVNEFAMALVEIAERANCAVEAVHHSTKDARRNGGNAGIAQARGASALVDKARTGRFLAPMTNEDAKIFGLPGPRSYVSICDDKSNYAARHGRSWFKVCSKPMGNETPQYPDGDTHGVLEHYRPPAVEEADGMANLLILQNGPQALVECHGQDYAWSEQSSNWIGFVLAQHLKIDVGEEVLSASRSLAQKTHRDLIKAFLNGQKEDQTLHIGEGKKRNGRKTRTVSIDLDKAKAKATAVANDVFPKG
jgi:hypothetical protein